MITKSTKNPNANVCGTSFHNTTIKASVKQIEDLFGEPCFTDTCDEKVTKEWCFDLETDNGSAVVTLYDWKEYRNLKKNDVIFWHVGGFDKKITEDFKQFVEFLLH